MASSQTAIAARPLIRPDQLSHVRWIAGGTASGKSTVAAALAGRFGLDIYSGDRGEHDWLTGSPGSAGRPYEAWPTA